MRVYVPSVRRLAFLLALRTVFYVVLRKYEVWILEPESDHEQTLMARKRKRVLSTDSESEMAYIDSVQSSVGKDRPTPTETVIPLLQPPCWSPPWQVALKLVTVVQKSPKG